MVTRYYHGLRRMVQCAPGEQLRWFTQSLFLLPLAVMSNRVLSRTPDFYNSALWKSVARCQLHLLLFKWLNVHFQRTEIYRLCWVKKLRGAQLILLLHSLRFLTETITGCRAQVNPLPFPLLLSIKMLSQLSLTVSFSTIDFLLSCPQEAVEKVTHGNQKCTDSLPSTA